LGHLLKKGWKPLRTILIASWDAEEVFNELFIVVILALILDALVGSHRKHGMGRRLHGVDP
jgi:uncharacterized membrane protein